MTRAMTKADAIGMLSDGHAMWKVEAARACLDALGFDVPVPEEIISHWEGQADANPDNYYKGVFLNENAPGSGVDGLALAHFVANSLGCKWLPAMGRGFEAQRIAAAVRAKLIPKGAQ